MTFTKEWLQQTIATMESLRDEAPFGISDDHDMTIEALKMALAGMESEPVFKINHDSSLIKHVKKVVRETSAPQPLTTSERAELENYRNAQQVVPDEVIVLLNHLEDVLPYDAFNLIDVKTWNNVSMLSRPDACRAAMLKVEPVSQPYKLPENVREALIMALQAMEFMGDTLNNLDAVCAEDVEFVTPAFDAIREVLADNHTEKLLDMVDHSGDITEKVNSPVIPDSWIPCSEQMPEEDSYVVAAELGSGHMYAAVASWFLHGRFNLMEDGISASNYDGGACVEMNLSVTHWMPLPAAPQETTK